MKDFLVGGVLILVFSSLGVLSEPSAPRPGLRWRNQGRVYNLLSPGAQYVPGRRRGDGGARAPVVVISGRNETTNERRGVRQGGSPRTDQGAPAEPRTESGPAGAARAPGDTMAADDPYDPYKPYRNSLYYNPYYGYNHYDSYYTPRYRTRQRPNGYTSRQPQYGKEGLGVVRKSAVP